MTAALLTFAVFCGALFVWLWERLAIEPDHDPKHGDPCEPYPGIKP